MPRCVLVVAAHPDDEVLGCGGTMARHAREGDMVHVLFMTTGVGSRKDADEANRMLAANNAAKMLGAEIPTWYKYPDQQLDCVSLLELTQSIEQTVYRVRPDIVYTHQPHDLNLDHRLTTQAVMTAFRPLPDSRIRAIYGFETLSSTEWGLEAFKPTRFVALSYDDLEKKMAALREYDAEMRLSPHPRSYGTVMDLVALRGATVGTERAEAFSVLLEVER